METSESNFRFFYIILWDYRRKIIKEFSFPRTRPSSLPFIQSTIVPRRKSFVDGIAVGQGGGERRILLASRGYNSLWLNGSKKAYIVGVGDGKSLIYTVNGVIRSPEAIFSLPARGYNVFLGTLINSIHFAQRFLITYYTEP